MRLVRNALLAALLGLGLAQAAPAAAQDLTLTGLSGPAVTLTPADIAAMAHVSLTVTIEGKTATWQGVPLAALLARIGAPAGKALKGPALSDLVVVTAKDGYVVALSLAETDPMVRKDQIILADAVGGQPLPPTAGPYRLVVEGDLRGARSARMVTGIAVKQLAGAR